MMLSGMVAHGMMEEKSGTSAVMCIRLYLDKLSSLQDQKIWQENPTWTCLAHGSGQTHLPNRKTSWEQDPPVQVVPTQLSGLTVILVLELVWVKINQETPSPGSVPSSASLVAVPAVVLPSQRGQQLHELVLLPK